MKVKLNSNMITGVLFLIVSVALHILIPSQIRTYETSAVTAATVPTLLIRGMILCSVILLVQGILSKEKTEYTISGAIFTKENLLRLKPVIYIAMLIAYALLLHNQDGGNLCIIRKTTERLHFQPLGCFVCVAPHRYLIVYSAVRHHACRRFFSRMSVDLLMPVNFTTCA